MHHFRGIQEGCRCYDFIYLLHCWGFFDLWNSKQLSNNVSLSFFLALVPLPMDETDFGWFSQGWWLINCVNPPSVQMNLPFSVFIRSQFFLPNVIYVWYFRLKEYLVGLGRGKLGFWSPLPILLACPWAGAPFSNQHSDAEGSRAQTLVTQQWLDRSVLQFQMLIVRALAL